MQNRNSRERAEKDKKHKLSNLFENIFKTNDKENEPVPMELYKMNIMQPKDNASPPTV